MRREEEEEEEEDYDLKKQLRLSVIFSIMIENIRSFSRGQATIISP
jgi:hypothetical protein